MTRSEFFDVVRVMKSIWPYDNFLPDDFAISVWYKLLQDLSCVDVQKVIMSQAVEKRRAPSISEIRERVAALSSDFKDWSEGWESVTKAVMKYGYTRELDALDSLDEITATAVKRLGWKTICFSTEDDIKTIRANFRDIYNKLSRKQKLDFATPSKLKDSINKSKMIEGE